MPAMYETNLTGKLQEILDAVFNIEADQTPFLSWLTVGKRPEQSLATWVSETYPDVASTGIIDGTPATTPDRVDRYTLTGCVQHFRREWGVTKRANLTSTAGVREEAGHQRLNAMLLLKRMMEQQFLSTDESQEESGGTPWTTRGAFKWLQDSAQSTHAVNAALRPAAGASYTGALASLTEALFRDCLEAAANAKKGPLNLMGFADLQLKAYMDDWTNIIPTAASATARTVYQVRDNSEYLNMVDRLRFSAGTTTIAVSHFLKRTTSTGAAPAVSGNGLFLDRTMWDVGYMQKPGNTNLAEDGSGPKGFVDAMAVLRCKNPLGQVRVLPAS